MKKQLKNPAIVIVAAALVCAILSACTANYIKWIRVDDRSISLYVDGELVVPKDAAGKIVEPFIYNGTVYLPALAVSEALGKIAEWDEATNSIYIGGRGPQEITEITVSNAEELINALGSNKRIYMKEGVYNLSSVRLSSINNSLVAVDEVYDGHELRLDGIHNLSIEGIGGAPSEIIVEPRYAFVLSFVNSSNIHIANVKAGHTEGGYCAGGVFSFAQCAGISIEKTFMYGCGTYGLVLDGVMDMAVTDSTIYDCTYGIMLVTKSKGILFERCVFSDNTGGIGVSQSSDFVIDSCEFLRNVCFDSDSGSDYIFYASESDNVVVRNSRFADNRAGGLSGSEGIQFYTSNVFENNTF